MKAQQQAQSERSLMDSIEQEALDSLTDDELQEEIDGLSEVIKDLKKEKAKRKNSSK